MGLLLPQLGLAHVFQAFTMCLAAQWVAARWRRPCVGVAESTTCLLLELSWAAGQKEWQRSRQNG